MVITGQGFRNTGGVPTVTTSDPNIIVGLVTFNTSTQLTVAISPTGGFMSGTTNVTVTNQAASGGYSGRRLTITTVPVELSGLSVE